MLTLAGCMLAAACSKENNGLLELSAEGYGSAAKTSVSGLTVQWESGDPYTGDPAQEAQGLNGVYASDSTTAIIKQSITNLNY